MKKAAAKQEISTKYSIDTFSILTIYYRTSAFYNSPFTIK